MKTSDNRINNRLERKEARNGYLFILPLLIGLIMFFIIPVIKSFLFSVTDISFGGSGYKAESFEGLKNYHYALFVDTEYRQTVVSSVLNMLLTTPLIMVFSFFVASVLNSKFRGSTFFKLIMFIPVIITLAQTQTQLETEMNGFSDYKDTFGTAAASFTSQISDYLQNIGIDKSLSGSIVGIADKVYGIINASGIQILVMIVGTGSISPSLYEAATVEGATAWECFWKITFPMAGPTIYTCLIYTIIDSFTDDSNGIMAMISNMSFSKQEFSIASAMGWIYFAAIAVILGTVALTVSRLLFYYDD